MRIGVMKRVLSLVLVTVLCVGTIPVFASTDENDKSERPAKPAVAMVDAPAPLTERERWLLDRVEELEKRVADLESKGKPSESPAATVLSHCSRRRKYLRIAGSICAGLYARFEENREPESISRSS